MGPLFLTGATGFVGRRFLERLPAGLTSEIRCLTRNPADAAVPLADIPGLRVVHGDLTTPASWTSQLAGCEGVLHLAAVTGKARSGAFRAVNVEATRGLAERARASGVRRFIFVSSIAAGFADQRGYPYAASKSEAEKIVLAAGLDTLVIRPTMVLGPGSPVLAGLRRIAGAPLGMVFGSGRVPVQPIHRDDLVDMLISAVSLDPLGGRTVEVGGPETLELVDLLRRIRRGTAKRGGPLLHLPLGLIRALLSTLEPAMFNLLPFTAGQLASFANPSVARTDPFARLLCQPSRSIDEMISNPTPYG